MTGLSERLRNEGMQQGMQQGESRILRKQIQLKFGTLPAWADEVINTATTEQLELWAEGVLTASSIEELLQ